MNDKLQEAMCLNNMAGLLMNARSNVADNTALRGEVDSLLGAIFEREKKALAELEG